jgi:hypothetical protein
MEDAQSQLVDKLKSATNVLVTVSRNPSVDQLSALLGLTLLLNKQGKHAAAVFSGQVPSTLEFLKPEETIEKNTDSLRDFIIALDKNKADKLRYKVEDDVVRIFITPYKTSITKDDFEFSQGDFNVDLIIAIGVKQQEDLDEAVMNHGQILHGAAVATINTDAAGGLGSINWHETGASSLSELVTRLAEKLGEKLLDEQIATALLTGIVAETERFSNEKTKSETMSASAALMAAGANQQLVASELQEPGGLGTPIAQADPNNAGDGSLDINHEAEDEDENSVSEPEPTDNEPAIELPQPSVDTLPSEMPEVEEAEEETEEPESEVSAGAKLVTEPPTLGGQLTANTETEQLEPTTDPLSLPAEEPPMLDHKSEPVQLTPPPPAWVPPSAPTMPPPDNSAPPVDEQQKTDVDSSQTLSEIEKAVESPHTTPSEVKDARSEVEKALNEGPAPVPEPIQALNAQPMGDELHPNPAPQQDLAQPLNPLPPPQVPSPTPISTPTPNPTPQQSNDPNEPPPVPPPIPYQFKP